TGSSWLVAILLHLSVLAMLFKRPLIAVLLMSLSCFALAWQASGAASDPWVRCVRGSSTIRLAAHTVLAFLAVIIVMTLAQRRLDAGTQAAGGEKGQPLDPTVRGRNLHSGVILTPEKKPYVLLVPIPRVHTENLVQSAATRAWRIPFSGEYWF